MTRLFLPLVSLLALALWAAPALAKDSHLAVARKLFADGEYDKVVEVTARVVKKDADYAKARYLSGEALLLLAKPADAAKAFSAVVKLRPKAAPAWVGLAHASIRTQEFDEAKIAVDKALKLEAKNAEAWRALGELHLAKEESKPALKALKKAVGYAPTDPAAARSYVVALLAAEKSKEAVSAATRLISKRKKHPMGSFLLGLALEQRGKHAAAITAYEKALALDDAFLDAHKNLAILCHTMSRTYQNAARVKKAMHHYERYFALGGKDDKLKQTYLTTKGYMDRFPKPTK